MELRDIEIFLTLAEELHFGRTADRLLVSVARVSQAIKKQERGIGAELFVRDSRNVRLTPVGAQLRADLLPSYQGLRESVERARLAAQGVTGVLRVGMLPSNAHDLRPFWEAFRSRHPRWGLQILHSPFVDPFKPLRNGDLDVLVAWHPVEEPDLTAGPIIYTEPKVLMVSAGHELAGRGPVSLDVLGHHQIAGPAVPAPEYWEDAHVPFYTPTGRPVSRGRLVTTWDELTTFVAMGEVVQPVQRHAVRYHTRPDLAYLPIHDAPATRWGLVWRKDADNGLIRAFARTVRDLGALAL